MTLDNEPHEVCQLNYQKVLNRFKNRFGLLVTAYLESPTLSNLPLKIQKSLETTYFTMKNSSTKELNVEDKMTWEDLRKKAPKEFNMQKWDENILTYKFHLELKIQYPSFLSETIREAVLKVDQIGETTTVTTDGDDMRKSATYRVEEDSFD